MILFMVYTFLLRDNCHGIEILCVRPLWLQYVTMKTIQLTTAEFKNKVFDYSTEKEWHYKGELPAIIDFYADWCGPCKMVAPVLEELAREYDGKVLFYKVDTEVEQELSAVFGIRSIPTFLFIPKNAKPMMQPGALPKNAFKEVIEERLLVSETNIIH